MSRIAKTFEYKGRFCTIREISHETGMNIGTLRHRLNKGMDIVSALEVPIKKSKARKEKLYPYNGSYITTTEITKLSGFASSTVAGHLKDGHSADSIIKNGEERRSRGPLSNPSNLSPINTDKIYEYEGEMLSRTDIARLSGYSLITVGLYVKEKSVYEIIKNGQERTARDGIKVRPVIRRSSRLKPLSVSHNDIAELSGYSRATVSRKLKYGMTMAEIVKEGQLRSLKRASTPSPSGPPSPIVASVQKGYLAPRTRPELEAELEKRRRARLLGAEDFDDLKKRAQNDVNRLLDMVHKLEQRIIKLEDKNPQWMTF